MTKSVIIGCGAIYPMHAEALKGMKNACIAAVCDVNAERLQAAQEKYDCKGYADYKEMIATEKPDVVHICLPHYLHAPVAEYALEQGCNVVTEKPMAICFEDAKHMLEAEKKSGKRLFVIMQNRYNNASVKLKEVLSSGALGKVKEIRGNVNWYRAMPYYTESGWRGKLSTEGGGALINQSVHTLDLMLWFMGGKPKTISAAMATLAHDIEVEDMITGVLDYEGGKRICFYFTNNATENYPIEIALTCEKGTAKITGQKLLIEFDDGSAPITAEAEKADGVIKGYWGNSHEKQIRDIYACMENGGKPFVTPQDALASHEGMFAIYKSARENVKVEL